MWRYVKDVFQRDFILATVSDPTNSKCRVNLPSPFAKGSFSLPFTSRREFGVFDRLPDAATDKADDRQKIGSVDLESL